MYNNSPVGLLMIVPVTTRDRRVRAHIRVDPPEGGLVRTSFILTDQLRTISRLRLGQRLGRVTPATMSALENQIRIHTGL